MGLSQPVKRYTPDEYYRLERDAAYKSDYYDGEIFVMAGGTSRHALIGSNINREVGTRLKGTPCATHTADLRLIYDRIEFPASNVPPRPRPTEV